MKIVQYQKKYEKDFKKMSLNWIEKHFKVEPEDIRTLENIENLINNGAMVLFVVEIEIVLSTCMIRPIMEGTWEIGKLATNDLYLGKGAGAKVFEACINYAKEHGANKIVLYSHTSLKPAISIYEKFNFKEVPISNFEYKRCNYQAELKL
ncbi:GNAT family N-acetyltransferase [Lactococcus garvieae]|uniref:GNAT family N-acetyltransferase n=1 Tax=Lactococcus garvieae TaxID=1363 RepID=UPI00254CBC09|nr:GNAT family N-acetyltransferase [Lactococcus garvieae]